MKCIKCDAEFDSEKHRHPRKEEYCDNNRYPVYVCPKCRHNNEREYPTIHNSRRENFVRAMIFESYLTGTPIVYKEADERWQKMIPIINKELPPDARWSTNDSVRKTLNQKLNDFKRNGLSFDRFPVDRGVDRYTRASILPEDNSLKNFLNGLEQMRVLRPFDLVFLSSNNLKKMKSLIENDNEIRYKPRWFAIIDWLLETRALKNQG